MTPEMLARLRALAAEANRKILLIDDLLAESVASPEAPEAPPVALPPAPRALLHIGRASAQAGKDATVGLRLTCPEPVAGVWLNIQASPKLEFLSAKSKVATKAFRVEKGPNHFRALLMFTSNLETESSPPGQGVVQFDPETLLIEATYRLPADATPGQRYVVQAGTSGASGAGTVGPSISWPTLVLNWKSGGITPAVEDGYVEVIA